MTTENQHDSVTLLREALPPELPEPNSFWPGVPKDGYVYSRAQAEEIRWACFEAGKRAALTQPASQEQAQQPSGGVPEGPAPYSINEIEAWADDADKHGLKFVPVSSATLRLIVGGLRATRCGVPNCWKGFEK